MEAIGSLCFDSCSSWTLFIDQRITHPRHVGPTSFYYERSSLDLDRTVERFLLLFNAVLRFRA